jgi:sortase A
MFDDIRDLGPGDLVLLHTMGDTLAYEVVGSEVVWPDEMGSLSIERGADKVTLVTCTPYGVNDHRLLVHCVRTDYVPEEAAEQASIQNRHWGKREWAVLITLAALLAVGVDVLVHRQRKRRKRRGAEREKGADAGAKPRT